MLPGGLDICGLYIIGPLSDLNNFANQGKLKGILSSIHKISSAQYFGTKESSSEKLILFGCTKSLKVGIKSVNLGESGSTFASGDLKTQENNWLQINYNYSLSCPMYFSSEKNLQSLRKSVMTYLQSWAQSLKNTIILIDGKCYEESDICWSPETNSSKTSKRKKGSSEISVLKVVDAEILENLNNNESKGVSEIQDCYGSVLFSGHVAGRGYVIDKAPASAYFDAVRNDLIRTMYSRWEMHCDSLIEEPHGSSTEPVLHEPPRRLFLKGKTSIISLCDYLFPGDSIKDACQSAKELFDIDIEEENIEDNLENWADLNEFRKPETVSTFRDEEVFEDNISVVKRSNAFQFFFGGIAALLGYAYCVL
ncbi:Protein odr-4-like protein [Armadillidium nasatum]|uniref:Protein odr-4-like protein n=1 Tax=Armadillidium nasatum TaxID=96803 RepID=A0A5N5SUN7_9CRUS|nr:Protein odr-4-like protein [Armadillidium nasatum]